MGAQLWHHSTPWHDDPNDALVQFQGAFIADEYDLPQLLREHLENTREAVRRDEADGDPYETLDIYRRKLAIIEEVLARGLPEEALGQIDLVRKLHMDTGEGVGNILDCKSVSERRGFPNVQLLPDREVERLAGTSRPTLEQAKTAVSRINEELTRGDVVCFRFYTRGAEKPAGWYFVGNTID